MTAVSALDKDLDNGRFVAHLIRAQPAEVRLASRYMPVSDSAEPEGIFDGDARGKESVTGRVGGDGKQSSEST